MSTWVVQVVVVGLFALTCALAAAWMRGRLGVAAVALFVVALVAWVVAFAAIAGRSAMRTASRPATRTARRCTTSPRWHFWRRRCSSRCSALAMLAARGDRWRLRRARRMAAVASSFKLPDLGEGLTEGEVARWLVAEGQEIAEDDPLVEIQTDKATVEIPSPYAGTVLRILVPEGEIAPVGTELVLIGERRGNAEQQFVALAASAQARVRKATVCCKERVAARRASACKPPRSSPDRAGARRRSRRRHRLGAEGASSRTTSAPPPPVSRPTRAAPRCSS